MCKQTWDPSHVGAFAHQVHRKASIRPAQIPSSSISDPRAGTGKGETGAWVLGTQIHSLL